MSDYPKESRNAVRLAAAQLSAVVTIFLAGVAAVSKGYLISGMALMGFAVLYLIFELVTSEPVAKNVPGMFRLLMAIFAAAIFLALNESTIKGFFGHPPPGIRGQVPCVHSTIQTRIVARLHSQARIPSSSNGTVSLPFVYQELFYEVRANITSDARATASMKADYLQRNDMYRIDPEGIIAERVPESALDFKDSTGVADHYGLIVKADDLSETQPLVVTIRRSYRSSLRRIKLIKLSYVRSNSCEVERPVYDPKIDVERLNRQVRLFAQRHWPPMQARFRFTQKQRCQLVTHMQRLRHGAKKKHARSS